MHFQDNLGKNAENNENHDEKSHAKYDNVVHLVLRDDDTYKPSVRIEGTQRPTKIPVSRLFGPSRPNHSETENKKDTNAAAKINISDRLSFIRPFKYLIPKSKLME